MTQEELNILKQYYGKISVKKMKELFFHNYKSSTIYYEASKLNLSIPRIDYQFSWSPEMAYFVGLMASDGNLYHKRSYRIMISLQEKDKLILEQLKGYLKIGTIKKRKIPGCQDQYSFIINNKSFYNKLLEIGLTPKKSLTLQWPDVPKEYYRDFVRGFFDGDGSISFNKASDYKGAWRAVFYCASKDFIYKLKQVLEKEVGITSQNLGKHTACYSYKFGRIDTIKLGKWMYYDNCYCLNRKYEKFKKAFEV